MTLARPHLVLALVLAAGCVPSQQARRYDRAQAQKALGSLESPGLVLGEFALAGKAVVDGDTLHVQGLQSSLRLIGIDAEETAKDKVSKQAITGDVQAWLKAKRATSHRPVKAATPMGEAAKEFAIHFFEGTTTVRLERDHPKEIRDMYGRYLAYVFAMKGGKWVNYNVECVRAGMAPYFPKYSYSRRFHDEFVAAEAEAKAAHRGIWDASPNHYPDYPEREAWWKARADFIKAYEQEAEGKDDHIELTEWDAMARLEAHKGQEVTVLGLVKSVILGDNGPTRVILSRRLFNDLAVVFFDKDVFAATPIARWKGEFVKITGVVTEYKNKHTNKRQLQLVVSLPSQVVVSDVPGIDDQPQTSAQK